jgi:hypothetical protein
MQGQPAVLGYLAGVGGVNVTPADLVRMAIESGPVGQDDNKFTSVWL